MIALAKPFTSTRWKKRLSRTNEKVRNVCCLIYLEDLEAAGRTYADLVGYLASLHMECACSPIHDNDHFTSEDVMNWCEMNIDPETGDVDERYLDRAPYVGKPKKPHVHVQFKCSAQHDAQWWSDLMGGLLDLRPTIWEKTISVPGLLRYFCHMDDPDKTQYDMWGIHGFGGFDMSPLVKCDDLRKAELFGEVMAKVKSTNVRYFHRLVEMCETVDEVNYVRGTCQFWMGICSSRRQERADLAARRKAKRDAGRDS